jgi:hypothetical protein
VTASLSSFVFSGNFVATVTITNNGNASLSSVSFTAAGITCGAGCGANASLPAPIVNLAPGASANVTLQFPAPAGGIQGLIRGRSGTLTMSGTLVAPITGGPNQVAGWSQSLAVTIP